MRQKACEIGVGDQKIEIFVSSPNGPVPKKLTKDDVFGQWGEEHRRIANGMVIAKSGPDLSEHRQEGVPEIPTVCPIFGDKVPYKSITVVCNQDQLDDVLYWLEYVHGGGCVSMVKELPDGRVALRSDYQCW